MKIAGSPERSDRSFNVQAAAKTPVILEQLEALRDAKQELVLEDADNVNAKRHLAMIEAFQETQQTEIQEYDEDLVRKLLHQVTVYDDHLTFEFKSGLEVEISM